MRYILIVLVSILIGSEAFLFVHYYYYRAPVTSLSKFRCVAVTPHGVYAHWYGTYVTQSAAEADAKIITDRLIKQNAIPGSAFPDCELMNALH